MTEAHFDDGMELPPTPFEIQEMQHAKVRRENAIRERRRLRQANAEKGFEEPVPGSVLHVQLDGSVSRRTRAGIRFEKGKRVGVLVVDADQAKIVEVTKKLEAGVQVAGELADAILEAKAKGFYVTSPEGAERIIEDDSLHVYEQPMSEQDAGELKAQLETKESENKALREEVTRLQGALRAARMGAKDSGDGAPVRLQAAAKVREQAAKEKEKEKPKDSGGALENSDFGTPPADTSSTK